MSSITRDDQPGACRSPGPGGGGHSAAGRGRDRALHRALSQGGDRRPGRHPVASCWRSAWSICATSNERRTTVLKSIEEQGKLTPELQAEITRAETKQRLEDLYLPFKPKRRTKAQIAREAGLEPLAEALLADPSEVPEVRAAFFVDATKGV
jgi:hypothetical protein